ncbi:type II toxin-antitoxin system HicB family antitoxin, partial [Francisella noatunensis]
MKFRYKLQKDTNDSFLVTFPDIPEACTVIEKLEDLNNEATDALISAFDFYIESNMEIPCYKGKSSDVIFLSTNIALKV